MLFSIAEAAQIMGISRRVMAIKMANCRDYQIGGKGGLRLYPLEAFPEGIQAKILAATSERTAISSEHLPPTSEQMAPTSEQIAPTSEHLAVNSPIRTTSAKPRKAALPPPDSKALDLLDAWREILAIQQCWCKGKGYTQRQCDEAFSAAVKEIPELETILPLVAWGKHPGISRGSLDRYRKRFRDHGITGYTRHTAKLAQAKIDNNPELVQDILNFLVAHPAATLARCYKEIRKTHGDFASLSALRNWERRWKRDNQSTWLYLTDRDKWNNTYKVAFGTHNDTEYPNQLWELDSTPADIALPDGRHCALGLIDVYTRRAKVLVNKSSTAAAVLSLLRQAMIEWGLPTSIRTDNGSDYVSKAVKRFCAQMQINHLICTPGTPQAKPYIERFFGTYSHDAMPILPGYLGHNVQTVTKLRGGQKGKPIKVVFDADRFQAWTDEWLTEYHNRTHSGIKKSPNQALADALAQGWQPRHAESLRELDMLLNMVGLKKVQKAGIRHEGHFYIEGGLAVGSHVWVAIDPAEMGRVYWFAQSGEYGGEAIAAELLGIDRREVAMEADQKQKADIRAGKAKIKKAKSSKRPYVAAALAEAFDPSGAGAPEPKNSSLPSNVVPIRKATEPAKPFGAEGANAPFFTFVAPWLAGTLPEAIAAWPDQDRMANIAARSSHRSYWGSITPLLREQGITPQNAPEYFAEVHRIASSIAQQQLDTAN